MRTSFLFAATLSICSTAAAQQLALQWAGPAPRGVESVQFASNGDLFSVGHGSGEVKLQRFNESGAVLWTRTLSAPTLRAFDMDVDASDNIYVYLAFTTGQLDLDPGPLTTLVDPGKVYAKYDSSGQFQWGFSIGDPTELSDVFGGISCDDAGNLYVTATLGLGTYDLDPGPDVFSVEVPTLSTGTFVARYRADGTFHWGDLRAWTGGFSSSRDIAALPDGRGFYLVQRLDDGGPIFSPIDVDPGPGVFNVFTDTYNLLRYDSTFAFLAHANIGYDYLRMATDNDDKAYFMTRQAAGTALWAAKYSRNGQALEQVFQTSLTTNGNLNLADIVPDGQGGFLGSYSNNCNFNVIRFFKVNVSGLVDLNLFLNSGFDCSLPLGKGFDLQGGKLALGTFNGTFGVDYDPGPGTLFLPVVGNGEGALGVFDWCASAPFDPFGIDLVTSEWCLGDTITLEADAFGDASGYTWNAGDWVLLSGQGSGTIEVITGPTLINTVTLEATNACGSSAPVPLPILATSATAELPEDVLACYEFIGELDPGPCAGCTYVWQPGGATTATLPVDIEETTTFTVEATNGPCTASDEITIVIDPCLGIEVQDGSPVVLSPVPVQRGDRLVVRGAKGMEIHQLIGADGREHALDMERGEDAARIRTNGLAPGQYVLRFADGTARTFVVQ